MFYLDGILWPHETHGRKTNSSVSGTMMIEEKHKKLLFSRQSKKSYNRKLAFFPCLFVLICCSPFKEQKSIKLWTILNNFFTTAIAVNDFYILCMIFLSFLFHRSLLNSIINERYLSLSWSMRFCKYFSSCISSWIRFSSKIFHLWN